MNAATTNGDIKPAVTCSGKRTELRDLATKALDLWSLTTIEEVLAHDAALTMPLALRTRTVMLRLPQYQVASLKIVADEGGESVDTMVERMLQASPGKRRSRSRRAFRASRSFPRKGRATR
jgi:hypothetical protein